MFKKNHLRKYVVNLYKLFTIITTKTRVVPLLEIVLKDADFVVTIPLKNRMESDLKAFCTQNLL